MHLKTLLAGLSLRSATADMETEITHISYDSRTTAPGDVFVAMTGFATDGHAYIGKAVAAGAAAVVCERPPEDSSVPYVLVENSRRALAVMAANYYGHPADSMTMVAVTGTNGKTTTTYLLKAILFQNCDVGVCNADDPWTERLLQNAACRQYFYAEHAAADLRAEHITLAADHIAFDAVTKDSRTPIKVGIPGGFMVYNTLDVLGAALALGVPLEKSARVLAAVPHVKGRVEVVPTPGKDYTVLIDYSHTRDSLENILRTVKGFAKGRTVALFGCGGDRDRTKRPIMGSVAAELADFVVVTSDNPRTEDPEAIIADILPGLEGSGTPYQVICDRVEAIHWAMDHAQPGDVIALCGKGHETYQEVNHEKHHMDEREIVAEHLTGK